MAVRRAGRVRGQAGRARARAQLTARRGLWGVARIVRLITSVVVGLVVVGIVLVLLEANRDNAIVDWLVGAADWLSEPFHGAFTPDGRKAQVAVNWGLAALVYAVVGGLVARLLRR
jgi:xanthine/uracil permease